jgi:uncharacterized membrane protein
MLEATPTWALTIAFWLHMLATVVWIGGLAALSIFVLPAARKALDSSAYASLLESMQRRLDPMGWLCLLVLLATGLVQMSASPNYHGFLAITNQWAITILAKHIVFGGMTLVSAYLTWGLMPALQRNALLQARGKPVVGTERLHNRELLLLRLNLILGILVLALTALARTS